MADTNESIEALYNKLTANSKDEVLRYAKILATGEANARKADEALKKESSTDATA